MESTMSEKMKEVASFMKEAKILEYDGRKWAPFPGFVPDTESKFEMRANMECRDSDIFLCSYPKAGTNWAHEVLTMIMFQSTAYTKVLDPRLFLEMNTTIESIDALPSPRVFMTHLPYQYLPNQLKKGTGKIVYIQRNPKDLHVSFYNFQKSKPFFRQGITWSEFFEDSVIGNQEQIYGGWYKFTLEYEQHLKDANLLPVYYEDMKKDLAGSVLKIADFLGVSCTEEFAEEIADKCSFDKMKNNRVDPTSLMNKDSAGSGLYRKGQVGDWKNWFTVAQNERFDEHYNTVMKDSKIKFIYEL